jgi:hypothetical protein
MRRVVGENKEKNLSTQLVQVLDDLTRLYQNLHSLLLSERNYLIKAQLEELVESNKTKEALLLKIKQVDREREARAIELANHLHASEPRLLAISQKLSDKDEQKKFKSIHQALTILLTRVSEANRDNETYADSALKNIDGALRDIKDTLAGKSVYGKKGSYGAGPDQSGNIVRREA